MTIYCQISGGIKLQRLSPIRNEKVIEIIHSGQTFAEAVLFAGSSRYLVSAVAIFDSVVVGIDAKNYLLLLSNSTELWVSLLATISKRLHSMVNKVDRLTLHNATLRRVDYLLSRVSSNSVEQKGISLNAPKNVIASRLSIKPETL